MEARLTLKPRQKGTLKLAELYGSRLVCVRYPYDEQHQKRLKTIEIIFEETAWIPKPKPIKSDQIVCLQIEFKETDLRQKLRAADGKWNLAKRSWEIP